MDCSRQSGKNIQGRPLSLKKEKKTVSLPYSVRLIVVVSHKWIEGPELHPSDAQLLCGVAFKATDVCPNKGDAKQAELQHRWWGGSAKGQFILQN